MRESNFKEHKGRVATDRVTGFKGIVTGHAEYLTGCSQYCLTPETGKDKSTLPTSQWIDITKLDVEVDGYKVEIDKGDDGCDSVLPHCG